MHQIQEQINETWWFSLRSSNNNWNIIVKFNSENYEGKGHNGNKDNANLLLKAFCFMLWLIRIPVSTKLSCAFTNSSMVPRLKNI